MYRLACLTAFVKVVDKGGFAAAARHLDLSPATVMRQVEVLEQRIGARLLNRTTRNSSLTEAGQAFYERCVQILEAIQEAESVANAFHATPQGTLRLNASPTLADHVGTLVGSYVATHPGTIFDLTITERMGGLVDEGFDLAIRDDTIPNSSLIGRRLGSAGWCACGSPGYIAAHGSPSQPADLAGHDCLIYVRYEGVDEWRFTGGNGRQTVRVTGSLRSNDPQAVRTAALAGQGLALLPEVMVAADLRLGRLVRVLRDCPVDQATVRAIFPSRRQLSLKVRTFLDFMAEQFGSARHAEAGSGLESVVAARAAGARVVRVHPISTEAFAEQRLGAA
jgi:DNA-binding transcriptional LysR family regulator